MQNISNTLKTHNNVLCLSIERTGWLYTCLCAKLLSYHQPTFFPSTAKPHKTGLPIKTAEAPYAMAAKVQKQYAGLFFLHHTPKLISHHLESVSKPPSIYNPRIWWLQWDKLGTILGSPKRDHTYLWKYHSLFGPRRPSKYWPEIPLTSMCRQPWR